MTVPIELLRAAWFDNLGNTRDHKGAMEWVLGRRRRVINLMMGTDLGKELAALNDLYVSMSQKKVVTE